MLTCIYIILLLLCFYFTAIVCDEFFVWSLNKISQKLKISSEVTWATFMAIGSSAPELFTSIFALFFVFGSGGNEAVGAGTIVGSAIFNVLIITWLSLVFSKSNKKLYRQPVVRDLLFYTLTVTVLIISLWDGQILFYEAGIMVALYTIYVFVVSQWSKWLRYNVDENELEEVAVETKKHPLHRITHKFFSYIIPNPNGRYRWTFFLSVIVIALLSYLMVHSAVYIAESLSIPKVIIGLTILAAWTSVPDLLSSIIVSKKGKVDMAVSNGLWSNVFDILIGLWFVYFIYFLIHGTQITIPADKTNLWWSTLLLFGTIIVIISIFVLRKRKTSKWIGWFLVILYLLYLARTIYTVL